MLPKNVPGYVTPGELQLQLKTLGEKTAQAVLRDFLSASIKRREQVCVYGVFALFSAVFSLFSAVFLLKMDPLMISQLNELLSAAVERIGEGHNGLYSKS